MIEITPVEGIDAIVTVPGSKSITQRALIAASLADGDSVLHGPLISDDTEYSSRALSQMGIEIVKEPDYWRIQGTGGTIREPEDDIFLGNNWILEREDLLGVYPYHVHLQNYVDSFRAEYHESRGRL